MIAFQLIDTTYAIEINHWKYGLNYLLVDSDTYEKIRDKKISIHKGNGNQINYYTKLRHNGKEMPLRNFIMPPPKGKIIDHKNSDDTLDERRSNLRVATQQQNTHNSRKRNIDDLTSKYKGIYLCKRDNTWVARITFNYKDIELGHYKNEVHAAIAYNDAAKKYFREFALLNDIPEEYKHASPVKNKREVSVIQQTLSGEYIKTWRSIGEAAVACGLDQSNIGACCAGRRNKHGGFKWKYA